MRSDSLGLELAGPAAASGGAIRVAWLGLIDAATRPHRVIGLSIWRVSTGLCLLYWYLAHYLNRHYLWGPHGVVPYSEFLAWRQLSLYSLSASSIWFELVFHAGIIAAVLFVVGWHTRIIAVVNFIFHYSIYTRNHYFLNAGDNLTILVQFLLLFACTSAHFAVDVGRPRPTCRARRLPSRCAAALHNAAWLAALVQLAMVYTMAGMHKISGDMWSTGTALYYVLRVSEYSFPPYTDWLTRNAYLVVIFTYATIVFQIGFALALTHKRTRLLWAAGGVAFHVGIGVLMGLISFSWFVLSVYALLIADDEYRRWNQDILAWVSRRRLAVYYDGACPLCIRAVRMWKGADVCSLLAFRSFRDPGVLLPATMSLDALERRIHVMTASGRVAGGSRAVLAIVARLPLLWPLWPILSFINRCGFGERAYLWIADRRIRLLSPLGCSGAECEVSPVVRPGTAAMAHVAVANAAPVCERCLITKGNDHAHTP